MSTINATFADQVLGRIKEAWGTFVDDGELAAAGREQARGHDAHEERAGHDLSISAPRADRLVDTAWHYGDRHGR